MTTKPSAKQLVQIRCQLGENPLWDAQRQTLFWTDIVAGELHAWHEPTAMTKRVYEGPTVGGFTLEADGALLLFRINDLARFNPETGECRPVRTFTDEGTERFNDVMADGAGRVYAGTIGRTKASGGLFRFDPDGSVHPLFRGTGVSNGMGISPDGQTFYWTCSTTNHIFAFDYDAATGNLSNRRIFYAADTEDEGTCDGLCVDVNGTLWSARWDGHRIRQHAPDGKVLSEISVAASRVTSCCFGGADGKKLFITSARGETDPGYSSAGDVFVATMNTTGLLRPVSRLTSGK
ncbi:MAG: SMP-30/gluconolactonase/LRE family protein [Opitutaceae bacterium]|jgi:sugar lactone lactonase YvrE|nr:SMP-30/gluconolactonase/LRE family protein [Opitutaceae bacterium]MBP9913124.1 SMP-30/gluconolactonase/LRE family protein [Opitutaceae bacterium]